jgi:hypothetical protein
MTVIMALSAIHRRAAIAAAVVFSFQVIDTNPAVVGVRVAPIAASDGTHHAGVGVEHAFTAGVGAGGGLEVL